MAIEGAMKVLTAEEGNDRFAQAVNVVSPRHAEEAIIARRELIFRTAPVYEFLRISGSRLSIRFCRSHDPTRESARLVVLASGAWVRSGDRRVLIRAAEVPRERLDFLMSGIARAAGGPVIQKRCIARPVKRRRMARDHVAPTRPGVVRIYHELPEETECYECGALVYRWKLEEHLEKHADPEPPHSVWAVSGGGPGTGKRR